jgi:hypothetical protein
MPKSSSPKATNGTLFGDPEEQRLEIRKAHQAIFIRPDQNPVPLIARKLFNVLVRHAQESGLQHDKYSIPFRTIVEQLAYESNDYDLLKGHLRQLQKIQVEWDAITEKGKRRWGVSGLVMYAEIADGVCTYAFMESIKAELLNPQENYFRFDLRLQSIFRRPSSLALYEMCGRYATNPSKVTARLPWKEWRDLLCRDENHLYDEFKFFNSRLLKPTIAEVNAMSDLEIEPIIFRDGWTVTDIQFKVGLKATIPAPTKDTKGFNTAAYKRLVALHINPTRARRALAQYGDAEIEAATDLLERRINAPNLQKLTSAEAYFFDALKKGYAPAPSQPSSVNKAQDEAAAAQNLKEQLKAAFDSHRMANAERLYLELDDNEQVRLREQFIEEHGGLTDGASAAKLFRTKGLKSKTASALFFAWHAQRTWGNATEIDLLNFAIESGLIVTKPSV